MVNHTVVDPGFEPGPVCLLQRSGDESIGIRGESWWPLKNQPQLPILFQKDESMSHVGGHIMLSSESQSPRSPEVLPHHTLRCPDIGM